MNFSSQIFFNNINHGHRAAISKKKIFVAASLLHGHCYLLLLSQSQETRKKPVFPFLLTMLMCSAIVSYLLKCTYVLLGPKYAYGFYYHIFLDDIKKYLSLFQMSPKHLQQLNCVTLFKFDATINVLPRSSCFLK